MKNDTLRSKDLLPLEALFVPGFPEVWREVATSIYKVSLEEPELAALGQPRLAQIAVTQTKQLAHDLGGGMMYLPVGHLFHAGEKALAVIAGFRGDNLRELATAHGVTDGRVRQIIDLARKIVGGFRGNNHEQLARDHDVTPERVRQILAAWAQAQAARPQGQFQFDEE